MAPDTARRPATVSDAPDKAALRAWRLGRLRQELKARDYAGALLYDPINIRYACDVRNMQVWCLHNAARYVFEIGRAAGRERVGQHVLNAGVGGQLKKKQK